MKIVLVGAGGYGVTYFRLMENVVHCLDELCAVVDPYAKQSPSYPRFLELNIPIYETLEDFFASNAADLVIISSPIQFHEEQAICAMQNGAHVLCEKPLTAQLSQALHIQQVQKETGKIFGVGFQWSFSQTIQKLKSRILSGIYGKPVCLKTFMSWPREDAYYNSSGWKGRLRDANGMWVMDSIATNATAHYLHNIFYVLGDDIHTSKMPVSLESSLFKARPIETFDTCFLRGAFADGSTFLYIATHVGEQLVNPIASYAFEKATIEIHDDHVYEKWPDGRIEDLGNVNAQEEVAQKIFKMRDAVLHGTQPDCGIDAALPHLKVCNALFEHVPVQAFPAAITHHVTDPASVEVEGLVAACRDCFERTALPARDRYTWAADPVCIQLS